MNTIASPQVANLWEPQSSITRPPVELRAEEMAAAPETGSPDPHEDPKLRKAFSSFVGQTFYGQMLSAMRKTVDKPAYFHGGRAEEIFQGQLDQTLSEHLADASADDFIGPMFDLFTLPRR